MKRKIAIGVLAAIVLVAGGLGLLLFSIFGGNKPIENGATYGRATQVEDLSYVSMFLVDIGGGKFVLVDGGADQGGEAIRAALEAKGATPENIEAIVLTHGHADHVGAAYGLTETPLWVHEADAAITEGREAGTSTMASIAGANPTGLKVTKTFKGGDVLEFGDVSFEVFHAPGHTAGNCAFLVGDVLLLGDTAQATTADKLRSAPTIFSDDPAQAIASIRALGKAISEHDTQPTVMVGAHSGATKNIPALLEYVGD